MVEGYGGRGSVDCGGWDHVLRGRLASDIRVQCWRPRRRFARTPFGWLRITGAYGLMCGLCGRAMGSGCVCDYEGPHGERQDIIDGSWDR